MEELLQQRFGVEEKERLLELSIGRIGSSRGISTSSSRGGSMWCDCLSTMALLEDDATPGQLRPDAFRWLDRAIAMAAQAGIYVIVDMHGAPGGQSNDQCTGHGGQNKLWLPENRKRAAFLWKKIAERYRDNPTVAAYDLLNEPYGDYHGEPPDLTQRSSRPWTNWSMPFARWTKEHLILCAGSTEEWRCMGLPLPAGGRTSATRNISIPACSAACRHWKRTRGLSVSICGGKRSCSSNGTCRSWPASSMWSSTRRAARP